jgi:hypothetical protein
MLREGKAGELFAEILHHIVAFELAVDEHVEAASSCQRTARAVSSRRKPS